MPTKPRTKKPAAKPQRKPRKAQTTPATAKDIGRSIGDALGRRLEDLLAKPDTTGFDAVCGWTVEKLGDGVTGYRANYATDPGPERVSPVEAALNHLCSAIIDAECVTDAEAERLEKALALPTSTPPPPPTVDKIPEPGTGALSHTINYLAERICADNRRRNELLGRLEL